MSIKASDILAVTKSVTKEWEKQRKAEDRGNRSRKSRENAFSCRVNFSDVADQILPVAYEHASGGGRYTVSKKQLYYAARESFRDWTGRQLEYAYFANTLLVQFLNRHPETVSWKVTAHPCGTLEIDAQLEEAAREHDDLNDIDARIDIQWPSLRAGERYQAVLYIEKEGFGPLLEEAKIAERFDLAVFSCKGQSVVAARRFVDSVCPLGAGIPLFVVHDFDKAGFEIAQRLTQVSEWAREQDRVAYEFENEINVVDLGLRLADVEEFEFADEECDFKGRFAADSIATSDEKTFLRSGRRVELNVFTSPQFIEWLEAKLVRGRKTRQPGARENQPAREEIVSQCSADILLEEHWQWRIDWRWPTFTRSCGCTDPDIRIVGLLRSWGSTGGRWRSIEPRLRPGRRRNPRLHTATVVPMGSGRLPTKIRRTRPPGPRPRRMRPPGRSPAAAMRRKDTSPTPRSRSRGRGSPARVRRTPAPSTAS